ncbi:FKBP-type peptidyl-prolyl cis-trans isomerase [Nocardioides bigeumensis]|uniref:peptidylprolyl isomerase n=1 Tax=Nocardioides bigeumensis TaxID=433657 RepID=A0ABN2XQU0_9ACTN
MLLSLRRPAAALCVALLIPALAACGGDSGEADDNGSSSESTSGGAAAGELSEVAFEGDVGDSLKATWESAVEAPDATEVTTLVAGDGDALAEGDTVTAYLWLGNGKTKEELYNGYDAGAPESIPNTPEVGPVFVDLLADATYGSRVAAVTSAGELFGDGVEGNQFGVVAEDPLVVVVDLVEKQQESPEPTDDKVHDADPSTQPTVVEEGGKPTGLDFEGIEEPELDTPVQRVVLEEGDGAVVKKSDTLEVDYLGATYDAEAPFDESFSKEPMTSALTGLIPGWSIGLEGVKVGSRVLLQIPPAYGYGSQGSGAIPANATLWFVIDVISAKKG